MNVVNRPGSLGQLPSCIFDYEMINPSDPFARLREILSEEQVNAQEFYSVIEGVFGSSVIGRVSHSGLIDKRWVQLERRHCLEILACVGHSVTTEDLAAFLGKVKEMKADHPLKRFLENDPRSDNLLQFWRNPLAFLEPHKPQTLWGEIASYPKTSDKKYMAYTRYQDAMQALMQTADPSRPEFAFAPHEHLAKFVGYAMTSIMQNGMIIPIYDQGSLVYYQLKSHLIQDGLCCYLFTPIDGNPKHPAQLVFRGTHDAQSVSRDFDTHGVGSTVFRRHSKKIFEMVKAYADQVPHCSLEISGHSLGAADGQRALGMLVHNLEKVPNIKDLSLYAYCSPKLDKATAVQWKEDIAHLADLEDPPHIHLYFAEHEEDLVTKAGDFNLSSANAAFCDASYLSVKSKSGIRGFAKHHQTPFFQAGSFDFQTDGRKFTLYQDRDLRSTLKELQGFAARQIVDSGDDGWSLMLKPEEALTQEELAQLKEDEARLRVLEKEKAAVEARQKGAAQHSWLIWSVSTAAQPLKLVAGFVTSLF